MKRLLITGISGLIGKAVLNKIIDRNLDFDITAIVRPNTDISRFGAFQDKVEIIPLDLADVIGLKNFLESSNFDVILHIGALRGGRRFDHETYYRANVMSTEQMIEHCLKTGCELLFCSSVGVFGAIPSELPANNETEMNPDNYYHYTKIQCEKLINKAVLRGLRAAILRPSITYGQGDHGFPFQMVKMIDRKVFPLVNKRIWIHLCNIDTISEAFCWLLTNHYDNALTLNVADRDPVQLGDLVNFISRQLRKANYSSLLKVDRRIFALGEYISSLLKNELWVSRFQLISRSWIYDVRDAYSVMDLPVHYTIPDIVMTIKDYKGH